MLALALRLYAFCIKVYYRILCLQVSVAGYTNRQPDDFSEHNFLSEAHLSPFAYGAQVLDDAGMQATLDRHILELH